MQQASILIVDDQPVNLNILVECLQAAGFKTLVAANGEWALQQLEHSQPDLILLDIMMPGIDGFETCRRLKANATTREIPVIFMTALADIGDKVKGFDVGGVDYITKPFQQEEVLARVRTHLTIVAQRRQLEEVNARKDQFLSLIAHDLRSPVSSLRGLLHFTLDHIADSQAAQLEETIALISASTDNIYALIENLLTWAQIQRGVMEYQPHPTELSAIVARNFALLQPTAAQKQIALNNQVVEKIVVTADENMLEAVIRNLLVNALKFTPSGGSVTVTALQESDMVTVSVTDTGIGIPAEHIPYLFRIDTRYKRLGTAREKGTGLGLILCKEFVAHHGGRIWVESEAAQGSTFSFTLSTRHT